MCLKLCYRQPNYLLGFLKQEMKSLWAKDQNMISCYKLDDLCLPWRQLKSLWCLYVALQEFMEISLNKVYYNPDWPQQISENFTWHLLEKNSNLLIWGKIRAFVQLCPCPCFVPGCPCFVPACPCFVPGCPCLIPGCPCLIPGYPCFVPCCTSFSPLLSSSLDKMIQLLPFAVLVWSWLR